MRVANSLQIEWSSKIKEGGFSYPPQKEYRGLENPRSVLQYSDKIRFDDDVTFLEVVFG